MAARPSNPSSAVILLVGIAAGAAITWAYNNGLKEKLTSQNIDDLIPKDLLNKATQALQEGRDRVVEAIDNAAKQA